MLWTDKQKQRTCFWSACQKARVRRVVVGARLWTVLGNHSLMVVFVFSLKAACLIWAAAALPSSGSQLLRGNLLRVSVDSRPGPWVMLDWVSAVGPLSESEACRSLCSTWKQRGETYTESLSSQAQGGDRFMYKFIDKTLSSVSLHELIQWSFIWMWQLSSKKIKK